MTTQQTNHETSLSIELLKALALCQHEGTEYFTYLGKAYEGVLTDAIKEYNEAKEDNSNLEFSDWCADNLAEIEETDGDGEKDNYLILTDEEADEKCAQYIKDSLWAFNAEFIIDHSKLPYEAAEMIKSYQSDKCEDANDTIEALIEDMDTFIEDAISADGRGHFMNTYDGNENEESVYLNDETGETLSKTDKGAHTFYIYRIN